MIRRLSNFALPGAVAMAILLGPAGAAGQDGGWWAPVADRLPAEETRVRTICGQVPDLPVCESAERRERAEPKQRGERSDRPRADRDERDRSDIRWDDEDDRGSNARRGDGPPFCRNGGGHPVHGREWCRDKGWGGEATWQDASWEDVIFGRRGSAERRTEQLDRGGLLDVLGDVVLGRLERQSRSLGGGALTGRMIEGRARVLQIRAGDLPLAELLDADRDGRVDRVLLQTPR